MAALAVIATMGQPVLAATSLCVEDAATGFSWESGKWVQSNYFTSTYIIRPLTDADEIGDLCRASLIGNTDHRQACYVRHSVGDTPTSADVSLCTEYPLTSTETTSVRCNKALAAYTLEPDGEFILTRTHGLRGEEDYRDSLAIAVGKCSVIVP